MWEDDLGHFFTVDRIGGTGESSMSGFGKALSGNSEKKQIILKTRLCIVCVYV